MLDHILVEHCSPTMAGLKAANLFRCFISSSEDLNEQLLLLNSKLNCKGLYVTILRETGSSALILVYRKRLLQAQLDKAGVAEFLSGYGYTSQSVEYCISRLKSRFCDKGDFPHEIGIFAGYPLADVVGFIKNSGKNSKFTGCWKVYHNEGEAEQLFRKFQKCKDIYAQLFSIGRSIVQLTVAA